MAEPKSSWSFVGISPEARQAAEEAAEAAGMELDSWLTQLIKYTSAMELKGGTPKSLDETIREATAPRIQVPEKPAAVKQGNGETAFPGVDTMPKPALATPPPDAAAYRDDGAVPVGGSGDRGDEPIDTSSMPRLLAVDILRPHPNGYIADADEQAVQDAIERWREDGDLRPLIARPMQNEPGLYEVIAGVDRWHAARRAHIREVPVLVHQLNDDEALRDGLVARLRQSGPIAALDEGEIYMLLMTELGLSSEGVARLVNKTPAHIATMVRVLNLPKGVRDMLDRGEITVLHARALLDAPNPEAIARDVVRRRLDIYQTEQLVRIASKATQMVDTTSLNTDYGGQEYAAEVQAGAAAALRSHGHASARPRREQWETPAAPSAQTPGAGEIQPPRIRTGRGAEPRGAPPLGAAPGARVAGAEFEREPGVAAAQERRTPVLPIMADTEMTPAVPTGQAAGPGAENARNDNVATTELLERHLSNLLGLKVAINEVGSMGIVTLHYSDRDQLSELIARLNSASNG